jgi:hypothetical protein
VRRVLHLLLVTSAAALSFCGVGQNETKWLVIASSQREVVPALEATRKLQTSWPNATVFASGDCDALRPGLYLAVAEIAPNRVAADAALQKLKSDVPDAYVRECRPKLNSTLAAGVPLVDPSIAKVPADSVNWSDSDRVSSVQKLTGKGYLWIRRWYSPAAEDPLEGRRESVLYFDERPENAKELQAGCTNAQAVQRGELLALICARETAGDNLLHETILFDTTSGKPMKSIPHCREPEFASPVELTCKAESVNAQGELKLQAKRVPIN